MNVNLSVGNHDFAAEMMDVVQVEQGLRAFDVIITCRNQDMDLINNRINQIALAVFEGFEEYVDPRVQGVMMMGAPAKYHYTIKGTEAQLNVFRHFFDVPMDIQG